MAARCVRLFVAVRVTTPARTAHIFPHTCALFARAHTHTHASAFCTTTPHCCAFTTRRYYRTTCHARTHCYHLPPPTPPHHATPHLPPLPPHYHAHLYLPHTCISISHPSPLLHAHHCTHARTYYARALRTHPRFHLPRTHHRARTLYYLKAPRASLRARALYLRCVFTSPPPYTSQRRAHRQRTLPLSYI